MPLIFGFDIGSTSIGSAVIRQDSDRASGSILHLGARIFPEARDPEGVPLNQVRRQKRMMRRQLRRRRARRRALNELLASHGLLPRFGGPEWTAAMAAEPYGLRARGLDAPLSAHELGRALYHLAKRRHFKERDLAETGEATEAKTTRGKPEETTDADEARAAAKRASFVAKVTASGQTIGAVLAARPADEKRRNEHATRALVEDEFRRLVAAQTPHHPALADPAFASALRETIFHQRPVFWRTSTLGRCPLMPGEALCPRGAWLSQERRMLEKVNNLAFAGGNGRPLTQDERAVLVAELRRKPSLTWPQARALLEPLFKARGESAKQMKFNHEVEREGASGAGLKGNLVDVALHKAGLSDHPRIEELRTFLPDALRKADYGELGRAGATQRVVIRTQAERDALRAQLATGLAGAFQIDAATAAKLASLHFPQGWEPYSTAALREMLPQLEAGLRFGALINGPDHAAWRDAHFPHRDRPTGEILDALPSPRADRGASQAQREEAARLGSLRNPTVVRAQNELRKVVNNLIRAYGKPDLIRVELAREVGKSAKERAEMSKAARDNERLRAKARKDLVQWTPNPTERDIEKWILWQECGTFCPYTGQPISPEELFVENGRFEIEHIWPRSLSLDNAKRNKTLCDRDFNRAKGQRTPFEFMHGREDEWAAAKERVWKLVREGRWSAGKAKRFCAESMPDDFASRQLNDTGYAAREAAAFLKRLFPDVEIKGSEVKVRAVTGRVTAQLRKRWELNHILSTDGEKTRADHRHHAIDALVVACAHGGYTQKLSNYFEAEWLYRHGFGAKPDEAIIPKPWPTIREDAAALIESIMVSHRVRKKVSGPLHKETTYGDTKLDVKREKHGLYRLFVVRKPLASLSKGEVENIRDAGVKRIVTEWIDAHGGDPKKAFAADTPKRSANGPPIKKVRIVGPQKMRAMARLKTGYATTENNHHIAIYRLPDGKIVGEVVSLFEASKRMLRREAVIRRKSEGRRFVMSLSLGDAFHVPEGERAGYWIVASISGNGQIFSRPINDATTDRKKRWGPSPAPLVKLGAKKVSVDPIGRVRPAND